MQGALAITWFHHRRMDGVCEGMGIELHTLVSRHAGVRRYAELAARTIALLRRRRPKLLLVQNPSLVLTAFAVALRPLFGFRLVVDAHNEAVEPYINRKRWFLRATRSLLRRAELTIVTNRWLSRTVEAAGGRAFVLPDPIPDVTAPAGGNPGWREGAGIRIVAIATYAPDEPVENMLEAARLLPDVQFAFTGNQRKLDPAVLARAPANVRFTGFLPEADYLALLTTADGVLDLTLMDHCLVCGAYEAAGAGKPAILSDNAACRELFARTAVFTANDSGQIAAAVEAVRRGAVGAEQLKEGVRELREQWTSQVAALRARCIGLAGARP